MKTERTRKVLDKYKKVLVEDFKKQLNRKGSKLEQSIIGRKIPKVEGFRITMNGYAINVDQGRSAGKPPPMDNIKDWIVRNGIKPKKIGSAKYNSLDAQARAIALSIGRRGIKPHRFIDIVIDRIENKMTLDLANAYLRDVEEEIKKHTQDASSKN